MGIKPLLGVAAIIAVVAALALASCTPYPPPMTATPMLNGTALPTFTPGPSPTTLPTATPAGAPFVTATPYVAPPGPGGGEAPFKGD